MSKIKSTAPKARKMAALLAASLTATMRGTWIFSKILWLSLATTLAAGAHCTRQPALTSGSLQRCVA